MSCQSCGTAELKALSSGGIEEDVINPRYVVPPGRESKAGLLE